MRDAGFDSVAATDVAFDVDFESVEDAVRAQLPAGPVAAAIRRSGRAVVRRRCGRSSSQERGAAGP
jgi:hypothetical protein